MPLPRRLRINDDRPIVAYNTHRKEIVGIFSKKIQVIKYLFTMPTKSNASCVYQSLNTHNKVHTDKFEFPLALRFANKQQSDLLADNEYMIFEGYPKFEPKIYRHF